MASSGQVLLESAACPGTIGGVGNSSAAGEDRDRPLNGPSGPQQQQQQQQQQHPRQFSVHRSTEANNRSDDQNFYGPFAHLRRSLDYSYHSNYVKERQYLQDAIIEEFLEDVSITDVDGQVCTTPTEPWVVFTAGAMGAGKGHVINELVKRGLFPVLGFVTVDPDEIRRRLPEFSLYAEKCPLLAGELTRKESGYVSEMLTLAALQAGKNVLVDGSLRDAAWYQLYFKRLREEYPLYRLAIIHVVAPKEAVLQRAAERGKKTGRIVPEKTLLMALEQVPKSVKILSPLVDFFVELNNAPDADVEIVTEGVDWDTFQINWLQACAWVPGGQKKKKAFGSRRKHLRGGEEQKQESNETNGSEEFPRAMEFEQTEDEKNEASIRASILAIERAPPVRRAQSHIFNYKNSTEENFKSDSMNFYGPYSHIRQALDYSYHSNYVKERQWLQDAIIEDILKAPEFTDVNGDTCTTPTEPWFVYAAGCRGAGRSYTVRKLRDSGKFPLLAFVKVEPDAIREKLPEHRMYIDQYGSLSEDMTRKEVGYVGEIITYMALQAGKNCLIAGSLRDAEWFSKYICKLKADFPVLRVAMLHVQAPREIVIERVKKEAESTGRIFSIDYIDEALENVPKSVAALRPLVDYVVELSNASDEHGIELLTEGETWESFTTKWLQTCVFVPGKKKKKQKESKDGVREIM